MRTPFFGCLKLLLPGRSKKYKSCKEFYIRRIYIKIFQVIYMLDIFNRFPRDFHTGILIEQNSWNVRKDGALLNFDGFILPSKLQNILKKFLPILNLNGLQNYAIKSDSFTLFACEFALENSRIFIKHCILS